MALPIKAATAESITYSRTVSGQARCTSHTTRPPGQSTSLPAIGAPNSDAEGDGLPNLLEYFTGTNPRISNASPLQIPAAGGGDTLTFTHFNRPDVTWAVEEAPDLDQWGALNFGTLLAPQTLGDGSVRETVSFTRNGSALFYRIHATLTGP